MSFLGQCCIVDAEGYKRELRNLARAIKEDQKRLAGPAGVPKTVEFHWHLRHGKIGKGFWP